MAAAANDGGQILDPGTGHGIKCIKAAVWRCGEGSLNAAATTYGLLWRVEMILDQDRSRHGTYKSLL